MKTPKQELFLGNFDLAVEARLHTWAEDKIARRIWEKDPTVWVSNLNETIKMPELADQLGWLTIAQEMRNKVDLLNDFASEVVEAGFQNVVLLGTGGSSLASEAMMAIFGSAPGYPDLIVMDSTNPLAIKEVADKIEISKTLFLISTKFGKAIETLSLYKYFFDVVSQVKSDPGQNFVAITDPGSSLERVAVEKDFRCIFSTQPDIGGCYAVLTYCGLVPAALIGLDVDRFLRHALAMVEACGPGISVERNPALILGAVMGELALAAHDKLTFVTSPSIAPFNVWLEELIAESTGKRKTGILPVVGEFPASPDHYSRDRVFVYLRLEDDRNETLAPKVEALKAAGHPVIQITLTDTFDLAQEFFRWQLATAAAASVLAINPFDQPNIKAAEAKAYDLIAVYEQAGYLPLDQPVLIENDIEVYKRNDQAESTVEYLTNFLRQAEPGDYLALMVYVFPTPETDALLNNLRLGLRNKLKIATTVDYGPRVLHTTGQLYKGDSNKGLFIQITHTPTADLPIPGELYTFGALMAAQALGDYQTLTERKRRLMRFHFKGDVVAGLERLSEIVQNLSILKTR